MRYLLWLSLGSLVPGMLLRLSFGGGGLFPIDVLGVALLISLCGLYVAGYWKIPSIPWVPTAIAFMVLALTSLIWNAGVLETSAGLSAFAKWIRLPVGLAFGLVTAELYTSKAQEHVFWKWFFTIIGMVILLGFIQFYVYPDLANISTEGGWDPHVGRLLGTWMDPNFVAGFCAMTLPIIISRLYEVTGRKRIFVWFLLAIVGLALLWTFSRSGLLSAVIGLFAFFVIRDPKWLILGAFLITVGVASSERSQQRLLEFAGSAKSIVLQDTDEVDPTATLRIENWSRSLELWKKYPVIGIGYNTYRDIAAEEGIVQEHFFSAGGSDSTHLTVLVTTGITGFLLFLFWWGQMLFWSFRNYIATNYTPHLGFFAGAIALFIHAIFVNSLFFPFLFCSLMAVAGVLWNRT